MLRNPSPTDATGERVGLFERMRFCGIWRDYQQRALDEFDALIADRRVHIVAAPGSGKTILGLELARRLGRPALVLAPTRAVREQWSSRLVPLFLPDAPAADELSEKLDAPAMLTAATYQALHALWKDEGGTRFAAMLERLRALGPITLVLDEAHHLRREWWNALQALNDALPDARIVALTATPPYDAPFAEWCRYEAMCGPIDLEIGAPELVRNGDLCPHQDHVVFSLPQAEALDLLDRRRRGVADVLAQLRADEPLLDYLQAHEWIVQSEDHVEAILETPEVLSSILVLLAATGRTIAEPPFRLLGVRRSDIPLPSPHWTQVLLNALLFRPDVFLIGAERAKALRATLNEYGLIEGGAVRLGETRTTFDLLAGSLAKLDSIASIARAESANLGPDLRLVVLTDHVRGDELLRSFRPDYAPSKMGVVPIFDALRRAEISGQRIAVLTGTLVLLPASAMAAWTAQCAARNLSPADWQLASLPACPDMVRLKIAGPAAECVVELVTALFAVGEVTMLVGTQALLGEGWDAPCVNSLVLASNSAAFMLSNQMRGRAIRIDPAAPAKVANIWHLATVEPVETPIGETAARLDWGDLDDGDQVTSDQQLLCRRFDAFEGVTNDQSNRIESGIDRLGLELSHGIDASNERTFSIARDRAALAAHWQRSLGDADPRAHVRETASTNYTPRALTWRDTLGWLMATGVSAGAFAAAQTLSALGSASGIAVVIKGLSGAAFIGASPKFLKASWLCLRNGSIEGSIGRVASVVLRSLHTAGVLSDDEVDQAAIESTRTLDGRIDIIAYGLTRAGERAVMQAMTEVLGPIQNPRYLLERRGWFGPVSRVDYHAVPTAIATRKAWAEAFHQSWRSHVGASRLVFTRSAEGRIILLRARARSLAAGFQRRVDRRSAWR